jgi:hypothetical protein
MPSEEATLFECRVAQAFDICPDLVNLLQEGLYGLCISNRKRLSSLRLSHTLSPPRPEKVIYFGPDIDRPVPISELLMAKPCMLIRIGSFELIFGTCRRAVNALYWEDAVRQPA